jgi:DnaJ-class molecular chaperone
MKDPYQIIGVERTASASDIKKAYKAQAQAQHPDKGGDEFAFTELQWAYAILKDADKRAHWDRTGAEHKKGPTLDEQATGEILNAFQQWLQMVMGGQKNLNTDCIGEIAKAIRDGINTGRNAIGQAEQHLAKVDQMLGKFSVDNEQPNVFEGHLSSVKMTIETQLGNMKDRQTVLETAAVQLKHFTYSPEGGLVKQASQGFHIGQTAGYTQTSRG